MSIQSIEFFVSIFQIKVWKLRSDIEYIQYAHHLIKCTDSVETIAFHPFVTPILSASVGSSLLLYDFGNQKVFVGTYVCNNNSRSLHMCCETSNYDHFHN